MNPHSSPLDLEQVDCNGTRCECCIDNQCKPGSDCEGQDVTLIILCSILGTFVQQQVIAVTVILCKRKKRKELNSTDYLKRMEQVKQEKEVGFTVEGMPIEGINIHKFEQNSNANNAFYKIPDFLSIQKQDQSINLDDSAYSRKYLNSDDKLGSSELSTNSKSRIIRFGPTKELKVKMEAPDLNKSIPQKSSLKKSSFDSRALRIRNTDSSVNIISSGNIKGKKEPKKELGLSGDTNSDIGSQEDDLDTNIDKYKSNFITRYKNKEK